MQPKTAMMYIGAMDRISSEFVERIYVIRNAKNEMPEDFKNELNKWALESISYIALNQKLGLLGPHDKNSKGQQLIEVSLVKYSETNNRRLMDALCFVTERWDIPQLDLYNGGHALYLEIYRDAKLQEGDQGSAWDDQVCK